MTRVALAIGGVVMIGVGALIAFGDPDADVTRTSQVEQPIRVVAIDNDSGDVTITADDVTTTVVRQSIEYGGDEPGDTFAVDGSTLTLRGCGWRCDVDYEVVVPAATAVNGELSSGNLALDGVADVRVSASSGNVHGERLTGGSVEVEVDSGDIDLRFTRPADVRAAADSGNIHLAVPQGSYEVEGDTDSGDRDVQVGDVPGAPWLLDLSTDSGNVTVVPA